jgi:2-polyprenyl-3-methyl-5-hydroxy-6-metoxy-1,4-benzoquinol methylase
MVPSTVRSRIWPDRDVRARSLPSYPALAGLMARYRADRLAPGVDPAEFEARIRGFLATTDHRVEGFRDPSRQRDLSIRFHWGHDHDFGTFALPGRMGDRHLTVLARFADELGAIPPPGPSSLQGVRVLDVGCWTGGTSLLLAAMGAHVVAIEEVRKYVECLRYLVEAFGLANLEPRAMSLFDCTGPEMQDGFDLVLFAGVLYHVTDPVLALRLTFDALRDGGRCLVETAVTPLPGPFLAYQGPRRVAGGSERDLSRSGWNWFLPSRSALEGMMLDVGYAGVQTRRIAGNRALAVGRRDRHVDMLRAGLSARDVR